MLVISTRPRASRSADLKLLARLLPELYSTRSNYYFLPALYQAGSKILEWHFRGIQRVECVLMDSFTILFVLLLWPLATKST